MGGEIERRAEALDLEGARELAADAVDEPARRDHQEREHDHSEHRGEDAQADEGLAAVTPAPDVRDRDGEQHGGVELHRHGRTERAEAEPVPIVHERGERAGHERRRPEVEAGQHDRAEEEREGRHERQGGDGPHAASPPARTARRP